MQAVKNGLKSAARTPVKTALFTVLLAAAAAMLCVSVSVFAAVRGYLNDCGDYFHTVARLEYVGRDYPDETVFDPACAEVVGSNRRTIEGLIAMDCVLSFEQPKACLAYSPEAHIRDDGICLSFFLLWCLSSLVCLASSLLKRSYAALTEP